MASRLIKSWLGATATILTPVVAFAHTGIGDTSGFVHGFGHPISGLDHVLAMAMVGVFAWQLGGRALWLVPMTFVGVMAVSGMLGAAGIGVPFVEIGIALSVVVLGAIVTLMSKLRLRRLWALSACLRCFTVTPMERKSQMMRAVSATPPVS